MCSKGTGEKNIYALAQVDNSRVRITYLKKKNLSRFKIAAPRYVAKIYLLEAHARTGVKLCRRLE